MRRGKTGTLGAMASILRGLALISFLTALTASAASGVSPKEGLVPDAETAVSIAVAVFKPIFGEQKIKSQQPFKAELKGEIWHVYGSLPQGWLGGTAEAHISRKDGRVIRVWHGR